MSEYDLTAEQIAEADAAIAAEVPDERQVQMEEAQKLIQSLNYQLPHTPLVASPTDKDKLVRVSLAPKHVQTAAGFGRNQKFMVAWYNMLGMIPPVFNIGFHDDVVNDNGMTHVKDAHALLKGLVRPCKFEENGDDVYRYILKPAFTYEHIASMVCAARKTTAPKNAVFVVFVRFFENFDENDENKIAGEIVSWDWSVADPRDPDMPIGFEAKDIIWRK